MGGEGSGSWYRWKKKQVVEHSRFIDASRWMREGILRAGITQNGEWRWLNSETREVISSILYRVNTTNPDYPWVQLTYLPSWASEAMDYRIKLTTTTPNYGGLRWWFICPMTKNNVPCKRRVGKLYLPIGGRYYGCRTCHNLTYKSCQDSDKKARYLRRHPEAVQEILERNRKGEAHISELSLILKALL